MTLNTTVTLSELFPCITVECVFLYVYGISSYFNCFCASAILSCFSHYIFRLYVFQSLLACRKSVNATFFKITWENLTTFAILLHLRTKMN